MVISLERAFGFLTWPTVVDRTGFVAQSHLRRRTWLWPEASVSDLMSLRWFDEINPSTCVVVLNRPRL